jgi:hypothetical protein
MEWVLTAMAIIVAVLAIGFGILGYAVKKD